MQPLHYVEDGLLVHETGGPSVWFKLALRRRELLSVEEIRSEIEREAQRVAALTGLNCHLVGVPRGYRVEEWVQRLQDATPDQNEGFEDLLSEMVDRISRSEIMRREVYLGVYLDHEEERRKAWDVQGLLKSVDRFLSSADPRPSERKLEEWRAMRDFLRPKVDVGGLGGEIASAGDLRWLLGRTYWRGMPHVQYGENRSAWGGELQALFDDVDIENHHGLLRVIRSTADPIHKIPAGEFWAATLAYSRFPDRLPETGGEWLYAYEELDVPVEFSCRFRVLSQGESVAAMSRVVKRTIDQVRHIEEIPGTQVPRDLEEKNEHAQELQFRVTQEREALLSAWPRLMVTALTEEALRERVERLIAHYHDYLQIELVRPTGDQQLLFEECIPGSPFQLEANYPQDMNVPALAGAGSTANTSLGDVEGPYIGRTSTGGNPVTFDPHRSARINHPTLIFIGGTLGAGKSNLGYLLALLDRARGASVVYVDPKGEADGLMRLCAGMGNGVNCVRLDQVGAGLLDPWRLIKDLGRAQTLASTMLQSMLRDPGREVGNAIIGACGQLAEHTRLSRKERPNSPHYPALAEVLEILEESYHSEEVRAASAALRAISRSWLAEACFSMGEAHDFDMYDALTVLQFKGLPLPPAGLAPSAYTDDHRVATAVMHAMTSLAATVIDVGGKDHPKMIFYDDALPVLQNEVGRALLMGDVLRGRSMNCVPVVISQNATHLLIDDDAGQAETLASNLGAAFVFRLPDYREAEAGCRVLRIPPDEWNVHTIQRLGPEADDSGELPGFSECIFRDAAGAVGRLQVDLLTQEIVEAFSTTPGRRKDFDAMLEWVAGE